MTSPNAGCTLPHLTRALKQVAGRAGHPQSRPVPFSQGDWSVGWLHSRPQRRTSASFPLCQGSELICSPPLTTAFSPTNWDPRHSTPAMQPTQQCCLLWGLNREHNLWLFNLQAKRMALCDQGIQVIVLPDSGPQTMSHTGLRACSAPSPGHGNEFRAAPTADSPKCLVRLTREPRQLSIT